MTIVEALGDAQLFAPHFGPSWSAWRAFLAGLFGLSLDAEGLACFQQHTGRVTAPTSPAREGWVICGRRAGKSRVAALVAVFLACFRTYAERLAPGEVGTLPIVAADRRQARTVLNYVAGLLDQTPMLAQMVASRTAEAIALTNRVTIEIHTCSWRTLRGYTLVGAICDELAFWRVEGSANPDLEILNGLRPGLMPGAPLLCISSPYSRRGALWEAYRKHYAEDGDPVLVWQSDSASMNPQLDPQLIADAYVEDESAAGAEWGGEFRRDIESFVSLEAMQACVVRDRLELPPATSRAYCGFVDPSGGSQDSFTLAIAHGEDGVAVLDSLRESRPPFSPDQVCAEFAAMLRRYGCATVVGDRYGGEWPRERFARYGVAYQPSARTKSELYGSLLPLLNAGRVELLDQRRLLSQLLGLERRAVRGGRDVIDHPPRSHDDVINAAAGALCLAVAPMTRLLTQRPAWGL